MKNRVFYGLLAGTAAFGISPATAQSVAPPAAPADAAVAQADAGTDVVVTARRRDESLQKVPVAVTAFSQAMLDQQQMRDVRDLSYAIPNVVVTNQTAVTSSANYSIRGIAQQDSTYHSETGVGVYVDGVYYRQQQGSVVDFIDVDRIEVLRGPQGTLYGRNATGGVVQIITRAPDLEKTRFVGDITIGSYNRRDFRAAVSVPIIEDVLAAKVDFATRNSDGFVTDRNTGQRLNATDRSSGRITLLWKAAPGLKINLKADFARDNSGLNVPTATAILGVPYDRNGDGYVDPAFGSPYVVESGVPNINKFNAWGTSGTVTYEAGNLTLKSITAYRAFKWNSAADLDGTVAVPLDLIQFNDDKQFTQEVQAVTKIGDRFTLTLGAFYFWEHVLSDRNDIYEATYGLTNLTSRSFAIYGEGTFAITPRLSLTLGGRYTWDSKDFNQIGGPTPARSLFNVSGSPSWKQFTPKASVDYRITDNVMVYALYSRGFKAGTLANGRPNDAVQAGGVLDPEIVDNYEGGLKTQFFDNHVTANLSVFHMNYKGLQSSILDAQGRFRQLSPDARIRGLEFELSARPVRGLTLYGNLGLLDAKITSVPPGGAGQFNIGDHLVAAPKTSYKIGGNYRFGLGEAGAVQFGANYAWTDIIYRANLNEPQGATPAHGMLDAEVSYIFPKDRLKLTLAGKNLTGSLYWDASVLYLSRFYQPKQTWSLTLSANF